ncbi:MAG: sulfatase [Verrucomicrobiales bacterium]|nr:sulfatase [Verrucomicrobiales bacterium]
MKTPPNRVSATALPRRFAPLWSGCLALAAGWALEAAARPNILFLAVDDLRPQLGCYGNQLVKSPNIDRLAASGMVFERAYCQVPVCGASRASLLTGMRPTRTRFVTFDTRADQDAPGVTTLPAYFRDHGYTTLSLGKVFHHRNDAPESWSEPAWRPKVIDGNWRDYAGEANRVAARENDGKGPPFENADVPDETYADGRIAARAVAELERLKQSGTPFFLAAGFLKPHLPFNAPKRYWDLYDARTMRLPANYHPPDDVPAQAMHNWGELRGYATVPARGAVSDEMARTLIHGYHACVSYTDAQIGKVLDAVERLGLSENTIVVLWGDHGWNLGEHTLWCKHCNFDNALHVPLILRAPGVPGGRRTRALVEFVDIYPSLCELAGLPWPRHLEGTSFRPLLDDPTRPWKTAVFSRWGAGDSIRTDTHLFTEWRDRNGAIVARMLYDHRSDAAENHNLGVRPESRPLLQGLSRQLQAGWQVARPFISATDSVQMR